MKNPFIITAICWQTRNWRHNKKAASWCKDYALTPLTGTLYIGKLKRKEMARLVINFQATFTNKTEHYYFFPLCKSCYEGTKLSKTRKDHIEPPPFEIIG